MKIVYIAHCIGAPTKEGIENNLADLRRIIRLINLENKGVVPIAAYYADIVSMDDNVPEERERGIKNDTALLKSGAFDELWATGPYLSTGMGHEINIALSMGMRIVDFINKF